MRVTGPVVHELQAVLLADRYFETETEATEEEERFTASDHTGDMEAQTLPSGLGYPFEKKLAPDRFPVVRRPKAGRDDDALLHPGRHAAAGVTTAAQRGVEVHLVVSSKMDQLLVGLAQRSYYEELLVAGVRIHVYDRRSLHAKHLSIDDQVALIGSTNMDMRFV